MRRRFTIWVEYDQAPEEVAAGENVTKEDLRTTVHNHLETLIRYFPGMTVECDDAPVEEVSLPGSSVAS